MRSPELERFEATRRRTLQLVRDVSQAQMHPTPAPGKWSVGEVLDHLLLAERFFRGEIRRLIELQRAGANPVLHRGFADLDISIGFIPKAVLPLLEWPLAWANLFLPGCARDFLLRSRLIPAQHPAVADPRKGRPADELRDELAASLRETSSLFEANRDLDGSRMLHVHPLLGVNDVSGLLRILTLHEERHQGQIADILRMLRSRPRPGNTSRSGSVPQTAGRGRRTARTGLAS